MAETVKCSVIFQGSKLFWRTRNNVDVAIVQHSECNITEIIVFEPSINVEAHRIYLNSETLRMSLNHDEIESTFSFAKQQDVAISNSTIINKAVAEFIISRLIISEFQKEESRFEVALLFRQSDKMICVNNLVCADVPDLQPYETLSKNSKPLDPNVVDATLAALDEDKRSLAANRHQAAVFEAEARALLCSKQRWRIPIVLIKMDKGKVLNVGDAKIWAAVSSNLTSQKDIERVAKITAKTATTDAQLAAKKATRSSKVPARTPGSVPPVMSRANSSRALAGTATSQTRTHFDAEDDAVADSTPNMKRKKSIKRSNSSRALRGIERYRSKSRLAISRGNSVANLETSTDSDIENPLFITDSASFASTDGNLHANFANDVVASVSLFVNSISNKLGSSLKSEGDGAESGEAPLTPPSHQDSPSLHHHLSDLMSGLVGGKYFTPSLKVAEQQAFVNLDQSGNAAAARPSQKSNLMKADTSDETNENFVAGAGAGAGAVAETSAKKPAVPGKRRSFSETLLAMLVRDGSIQALDTTIYASLHPVQKKPIPSGLTSWLPWRSSPFSSAKVIPGNLADYTAAEFAK